MVLAWHQHSIPLLITVAMGHSYCDVCTGLPHRELQKFWVSSFVGISLTGPKHSPFNDLYTFFGEILNILLMFLRSCINFLFLNFKLSTLSSCFRLAFKYFSLSVVIIPYCFSILYLIFL